MTFTCLIPFLLFTNLKVMQLIGNAEIEESPVFVPSHPVEGMLSFSFFRFQNFPEHCRMSLIFLYIRNELWEQFYNS